MFNYESVLPQSETNYVNAICDRVDNSLDKKMLPVEVYRDGHIFRAEMDRIFTRSWVFVAFEAELPKPGDFVLRKIGLDGVIVTRSTNGDVNVLLNHCRHRGSEVCHEDSGNTFRFRCPYHGWIYKNDGELIGAPDMEAAYGNQLDRKNLGLFRAPRVESIQGFIFACLSEKGPTLREHLGGAAWVLDAMFGLHPDGVKVLGPPERFIVRADWKSGAENFAGDSYHVSTAHSAALSTLLATDPPASPGEPRTTGGARNVGYRLGNGNGFIGTRKVYWGYPPEVADQFDLSPLDDVQKQMLLSAPPAIGTIFPNLSFLRSAAPVQPGAPYVTFTNVKQWQPLEPGLMELWNWQVSFNFMSEEHNAAGYHAGQFTFGSGGVLEQDDTAVWEGIAKVGGSPWGRKQGMLLHYDQKTDKPDPNWRGPGEFYSSIYGEYIQRDFWRQWLKMMRNDEAG